MVMAIIGVMVGILLPSMQPSVFDQLRSTAQVVAADLAYARSLAVANNSNYQITFKLNQNRYELTHTGSNSALDTLPKTSFSSSDDTATKHIVNLEDLPHAGPTVHLAAVATTGTIPQTANHVEFGPLGQTVSADPTTIWLSAGSGLDRRFIRVVVNPVTGMAIVGPFTSSSPPSGITQIP